MRNLQSVLKSRQFRMYWLDRMLNEAVQPKAGTEGQLVATTWKLQLQFLKMEDFEKETTARRCSDGKTCSKKNKRKTGSHFYLKRQPSE